MVFLTPATWKHSPKKLAKSDKWNYYPLCERRCRRKATAASPRQVGQAAGPRPGRHGRPLDAADSAGARAGAQAPGGAATRVVGHLERSARPAPAADGLAGTAVTQTLQRDATARGAGVDRRRTRAVADRALTGAMGRQAYVERRPDACSRRADSNDRRPIRGIARGSGRQQGSNSPRAPRPAEATTPGNTSGHGTGSVSEHAIRRKRDGGLCLFVYATKAVVGLCFRVRVRSKRRYAATQQLTISRDGRWAPPSSSRHPPALPMGCLLEDAEFFDRAEFGFDFARDRGRVATNGQSVFPGFAFGAL
jgi:hypothetical protein